MENNYKHEYEEEYRYVVFLDKETKEIFEFMKVIIGEDNNSNMMSKCITNWFFKNHMSKRDYANRKLRDKMSQESYERRKNTIK